MLVLLLSVCALAQGVLFAWRERAEIEGTLRERTLLDPEAPVPQQALTTHRCYRALPAIAELVPPDARVLLVTDNTLPALYEYYFLPRPFQLLVLLDRRRLELLGDPVLTRRFREHYASLERRGMELTPEHLRQALENADYLVEFDFFGRLELPLDGLERVVKREGATLYRVRHAPRRP